MLHKIVLFFSFLAHELIFHTRSFITRVYPKMFRADSSNFNPQEFWNVGCQMGMLCRIMVTCKRKWKWIPWVSYWKFLEKFWPWKWDHDKSLVSKEPKFSRQWLERVGSPRLSHKDLILEHVFLRNRVTRWMEGESKIKFLAWVRLKPFFMSSVLHHFDFSWALTLSVSEMSKVTRLVISLCQILAPNWRTGMAPAPATQCHWLPLLILPGLWRGLCLCLRIWGVGSDGMRKAWGRTVYQDHLSVSVYTSFSPS